jgi:hypothetical protein
MIAADSQQRSREQGELMPGDCSGPEAGVLNPDPIADCSNSFHSLLSQNRYQMSTPRPVRAQIPEPCASKDLSHR